MRFGERALITSSLGKGFFGEITLCFSCRLHTFDSGGGGYRGSLGLKAQLVEGVVSPRPSRFIGDVHTTLLVQGEFCRLELNSSTASSHLVLTFELARLLVLDDVTIYGSKLRRLVSVRDFVLLSWVRGCIH